MYPNDLLNLYILIDTIKTLFWEVNKTQKSPCKKERKSKLNIVYALIGKWTTHTVIFTYSKNTQNKIINTPEY